MDKLKFWATEADVTPIRIPGYSTFRKPAAYTPDHIQTVDATTSPALPDEKIIYYLHGGAYATLSAHPSCTFALLEGLLHALPVVQRVFAVEYQLSMTHTFPLLILTSLITWFPPQNILLMGDSAGGNLALALMQYLVEITIPSSSHPR